MKVNVLLTTVVCLSASLCLRAQTLEIVNENQKQVDIRVYAEGDSFTEELSERCFHIRANGTCKQYMTPQQFNGKSLYAISGETNPFTSSGTCRNLSVHKNYKVVFTNDAIGTSCVATETTPQVH